MADDRIRIIVEPDTSSFQNELRSDLSKVTGEVSVPVEADLTRAKVSIEKFEAGQKTDPIDIPVDVDTKAARAMLQRFHAQASAPIHKLVQMNTVGAQRSLAALGSVGSKSMNMIGRAAKASGVGALLALGGAAMMGKDELLDMNRVSSQTSAILKNSGLAAKVSTKQIEDLSGAMLAKSGIDDQAIQSGANLLLSQKAFQESLKKQPGLLKQSTMALTDLASTPFFKGNAEAAAKGLGRALGDPIKGMMGLRKAGILFNEEEKKKIKNFVESGNTAKAQAMILQKVQDQAAGAAEARGKTVEGQMSKISESIAGFGASILGKFLLPLAGQIGKFLGSLKPLGRVFKIIGEEFGKTFGSVFKGIGNGVPITEKIRDVLTKLGDWFAANRDKIAVVAKIFADFIKSLMGFVTTLWPKLAPVLKTFGLLLGAVVLGLMQITTWVVNAISHFLNFIPTLTQVGDFLGEFIANAITLFKALPGIIFSALKTFGSLLASLFRKAWQGVVTVTKFLITAYIAYLKAVPLRIITAIIALGSLLYTAAMNAWKKFSSATVSMINGIILYVRSLPGRIVGNLSNLGIALYDKGVEVFAGLWNGLKDGWNKIADWLKGIGKKIKSLKGPIEVDRVLLVDEGKAIMGGFHEGLKSKWHGVEGWLGGVTGWISGMFSKVGFGKVSEAIGNLFAGTGSMEAVHKIINDNSNMGLHPSSGWSDTRRMVSIIERMFNVGMTSGYRPGSVTASGNPSDHGWGGAADFGDSRATIAALDKLATVMSKLVGRVFNQVIWRNSLWRGGKGGFGYIGGHMDHVHLGWKRRAKGGSVFQGDSYLVGEKGMEAFIPSRNGFILNNARLDRMLNVDRRLGNLENTSPIRGASAGASVQQNVTINMPNVNAGDAQGWGMLATNRLLEMLRANAGTMAGGVA